MRYGGGGMPPSRRRSTTGFGPCTAPPPVVGNRPLVVVLGAGLELELELELGLELGAGLELDRGATAPPCGAAAAGGELRAGLCTRAWVVSVPYVWEKLLPVTTSTAVAVIPSLRTI